MEQIKDDKVELAVTRGSGAHYELEISEGIAKLCVTNAMALNIVSSPIMNELIAVINGLRERHDVRVLVLRGVGDKAFIGGADINEMAQLDSASAPQFISRLASLCDSVRLFPTPVIARISGWCLGGGLELAMACDLRIAAIGSQFGMPEVKVGIPSVIHAALMPRLIGQSRANWLLLTAQTIDAIKAERWGLIQSVCPLNELDDEVNLLAKTIAGFGSAVIRQQKALLRAWEDVPVDVAIAATVPEFARAFATGEPQRFMGDFLEAKRKKKKS